MALVRRAPERVTRLCLMSTTSRPPTSQQYAMWARQRAALAAGATARDLQREIKAALLSPHARATRPDLVEVALAMADDDRRGDAGRPAGPAGDPDRRASRARPRPLPDA